jgi:hypothetical protein
LEPVEICEDEDYVNVCHWILRVERISKAFNTVSYEVRTGPMKGMGGIVPVEEFADRVVSRVRPQRERLGVSDTE